MVSIGRTQRCTSVHLSAMVCFLIRVLKSFSWWFYECLWRSLSGRCLNWKRLNNIISEPITSGCIPDSRLPTFSKNCHLGYRYLAKLLITSTLKEVFTLTHRALLVLLIITCWHCRHSITILGYFILYPILSLLILALFILAVNINEPSSLHFGRRLQINLWSEVHYLITAALVPLLLLSSSRGLA
jgi:hypothetical protein